MLSIVSNRHQRRAQKAHQRKAEMVKAIMQKKLTGFLSKHFPYHYVHTNGCGKVAFYVQHHPTPGGELRPEWCMFPNGDKPKEGDGAKCGSCGGEMYLEDLDPTLYLRRTA